MLRAARSVLVAAAVAFLAVPAVASAAAQHWVVDSAASTLGFKSSYAGKDFVGHFRKWTADIAFDPKALDQSKAVVHVDTGSATTGDETRDQAMPGADWFNVDQFPTATFVTRSFKDVGGGRYEATGDLTIKGVSQPLVLPFTWTETGDDAKLTARVSVDRHLFGVGQGEFSSPDSIPYDVEVDVDLTAHKAK